MSLFVNLHCESINLQNHLIGEYNFTQNLKLKDLNSRYFFLQLSLYYISIFVYPAHQSRVDVLFSNIYVYRLQGIWKLREVDNVCFFVRTTLYTDK